MRCDPCASVCLAGPPGARLCRQVIEVDVPEGHPQDDPPVFEYDEEWLAILRTTHGLMNLQRRHRALPGMGGLRAGPDAADVAAVRSALGARGGAAIPLNFEPTAPAYTAPPNPGFKVAPPRGRMPTTAVRNPQTVALLSMLGLQYNLEPQAVAGQPGSGGSTTSYNMPGVPPGLPPPPARPVTAEQVAAAMDNPEEIDLGDDLEDGVDDVNASDGNGGSDTAAVGAMAGATPGAGALAYDPMFQAL
eukprot:366406-Chlamydomonas_euryale.AAC.16